ncbi:MAG TPA: tetratricopeptide repeat protein [Leptospiraceae bacterium]|nr:tetratricopeptide repeat protein [Leptospiraceae bacterium]HMW07769.1 tetratricopeptide repeat protein [Leptospiraceae bacterium]HMX34940.1 tetratricopeptide repeat protein [Leptospiraceae bacterium]HMY34288.1 tetratricopeptide repeat protein [Leptospiraceae bacterium]HMZ64088.1 tetratricopeptide repeat protein [Leptospiraceae bacterium]
MFRIFFSALLYVFQLFLFQLPLHAQDTTNSHIKQLIQTRQLAKAREELNIAMQGNENDPTLNLYQTELWIIEGETYYNSGQYKKAMEIYQKAVDRYPSNPMVKMKYQEMIKKVKIAEERPKENTPSTETVNEQTINQQSTQQATSEYISLSEMISSKSDTSNLLLGLLCLENFVLIVFVFLKFPKKKE